MIKYEEILDEMLSGKEFVTYNDIADKLLIATDKNDSKKIDNMVNDIKQTICRKLRKASVLDYKNGQDARNGVKYKSGCEHYLKFLKDVEKLRLLQGDKKKFYATIGLGLLLDEGSMEVTCIEFECVRNLTNANYVKRMAGHILREEVLRFTYMTNYEGEREITFHPQYLKEYNNRWAVYGKCEEDKIYPICVKIDSIKFESLKNITKTEGIKYQKADRHFYRDYFKDLIGFTRKVNSKVQDIYITTNNEKVHNLIKTKPFHENQEELEGWSEEMRHGKFVLHVIPNIELRTKLLAYGAGITLEGNGWFQRDFKEEVRKMAELYQEAVRDK